MLEEALIINGRFLQRPVTGVERFAGEILKALDAKLPQAWPGKEVIVALPPGGTAYPIELRHARLQTVGSHTGHRWEQTDLPRFCGQRLLVSLCNTAPAFKQYQLVVIHDAAVFSVPQAYGTAFRLAYKALHSVLARRAARVATVSEFSRQELAQHLSIPAKGITVIPESGEHVARLPPDEGVLAKHGLGCRPFVLAVSSNHQAKNFSFIARALLTLGTPPFDVVVAGGSNNAVFASEQQTLPGFVKRVGYVSDSELVALYQHASCFVFPSIYEGFGLPPLEAMTMGCPVVASTAASIPEVCGDAAVYFDPHDERSFLQALNQVMTSTSLQAQLSERARARSLEWTWSKAADVLLQELRHIDQNRR